MKIMHKVSLGITAALLLSAAPVYAQTTTAGGQLTNDVNLQDTHVYSQTLSLAATGVYLTIPVASNKNLMRGQITGLTASTSGVLTVQDTIDNGVTWNNASVLLPNGTKTPTLTVDTKFELNIGAKAQFRFAVTTVGTGSATISYGETSGTSTDGLALDSTIQTLIAAINVLNTSVQGPLAAGGNPVGYFLAHAYGTTDLSGTVASGNTFALMQAANSSRASIEFQNHSTDICYLYYAKDNAPTLNKATWVPAGGYYGRFGGSGIGDAIYLTCGATGDAFKLAVQ